ncbi:MAG: ABC transporter permease [Eubacteriales bacterium]|nr:ABC transporter permease [Eubacteriales bacterium]
MLNRLNDYSKLSFRLFFKNKLISTIVLVILLVVSIFTITVMNIFFSYVEIGKNTIEETYNDCEKRIRFHIGELNEDYFSAEDIEFLSAKAKEWGYDSQLTSENRAKIDGERYHISYCNEYFNDYVVTDGKSIKDNYQNTQYIWLCDTLRNDYNIGDRITIQVDMGREFEVAGFYEGQDIVVNSTYLVSNEIYFYDGFDCVKNYSEIKKLFDQVTSKDLKVKMGFDKVAKAKGMELNEYCIFDILVGDMMSLYLMGQWAVLAVTILVLLILLGITAGVIKNYFNIYKEKNFSTLRMYSSLGIKDRDLAYMFVMPLVVLSIAIGIVALGISALLCIVVQPVILKFVFEKNLLPYSSLYMISPAPFFINILVILLFVMISFILTFKTVLSKKKSFLSEVK